MAKTQGPAALQTTSESGEVVSGIPVIAEPSGWYTYHRKPSIVEFDVGRARVLVEFSATSWSGASFGGRCLYAGVDGKWGAFTIRPNQSHSITAAEEWLKKRGWEDWGY